MYVQEVFLLSIFNIFHHALLIICSVGKQYLFQITFLTFRALVQELKNNKYTQNFGSINYELFKTYFTCIKGILDYFDREHRVLRHVLFK